MNANFKKLKTLLEELFQLNQADLDFGIYRIMNQKRDEITTFLEKDLLPQVKDAFSGYKSADKSVLEDELKKIVQSAKNAGFKPEQSPKVLEIREKISEYGVDTTDIENEVYSDLYNFFKRYYHEGDFLSLRRYKEGVYAIPYEGEEVKLHWANHDQYYIKTSEYFTNYTFKLSSDRRVHFKIVNADTEKDNIKSQNGNERRFILCEDDPVQIQDNEMFIRFEYRPDADKRKQNILNDQTVQKILESQGANKWFIALSQKYPTEKNPNRTLLEKHLTDYTARNTFDYFIHKDLGGFLRRELDFFIKNEVMHLDDIENETVPRVEQYLSKIKVIRKIAHKIIEFLAQLENFQKKLWLKKKFVIETNYCVTLDRIPEELYEEIVKNEKQREEWVKLFAIDKIEGNLHKPSYSEPLTVEFLKENRYLVLDTKFITQDLKQKILCSFENIETEINGVVINSENQQALNLLRTKYYKNIKCIFIDPPYNTGTDGFPYKDNYQHSSWLTMLYERIKSVWYLMLTKGTIWITIDDGEAHKLKLLGDTIFGEKNFIANVVWQKKYTRANDAKCFSDNHDHVLTFALNKNKVVLNLQPRTENQQQAYNNPDGHPKGPWKSTPLHAKSGTDNEFSYKFKSGSSWSPPPGTFPRFSKDTLQRLENNNEIWFGTNGKATPSRKTFLCDAKDGVTPITIWDYKEVGHNHEAINELKNFFPNNPFPNPKPTRLVKRILQLATSSKGSIVLDFFAGSGTTAHAVIDQNRIDSGSRKYICVEIGDHFYTVLIPRLKKNIYSKDWKDGKPLSCEGSSHMFKYIRLESYEDTLNNLELKQTSKQNQLLIGDKMSDNAKEEYMLSYMLDVESRDSASLLNIDQFIDPFNYKLNISTGSAGETKPVTVDLVETFNYLIGLTVNHINNIRGFRVIEGTNPEKEKVLIIWRSLKEKTNKDLDDFFNKQEYNPKDMEFDLIYVNGDNNLENLKKDNETWKVRLIEQEFKRLMFDVQDI